MVLRWYEVANRSRVFHPPGGRGSSRASRAVAETRRDPRRALEGKFTGGDVDGLVILCVTIQRER